jgi:ATP/maltotriose-dependent transcriptional regulator MalT
MPDRAAELYFMAAGAAYQANRVDLATAAARRIAALTDPAYQRYGHWLARSLADEPDGDSGDPWRVFAAAPLAIRRSSAHRWLFPLAIAWRGAYPLRSREFALAAREELAAGGMRAILTILLPWLIDLEYRLGWWDEGIAHADEGLRIAREIGQRLRVADLLSLRALFAAARGEEADCRRDAEQALQTALPLRNQLAAAQATWALGMLELAGGEHERASERLATLRTPGMPQAHEHIARQAVADAVEAAVRVGHVEQATLVADDFAGWVGTTGYPWAQAHLHRCRALLAADDSADKHFQLALSAADAQARPYDQARTALLYGQWLRRRRLSRQARVPLRLASDLFDSLGAGQWADRVRGELLACGAPAQRIRAAQRVGLTAQELQVARLAATGLSNREIAAQLFLSPRTVGYHLHKIFPKLGISTRSQLRHCQLPAA